VNLTVFFVLFRSADRKAFTIKIQGSKIVERNSVDQFVRSLITYR
jgi:hypothetical protein